MPHVDVSYEELELLVDAIVLLRLSGDHKNAEQLPDLHLKLENLLEIYTNGGELNLPILDRFRALGVERMVRVIPPRKNAEVSNLPERPAGSEE